MLVAGSALKGYAIEASDGRIGTVKTFLFDDATWKMRWLVIDTGHWLTDRQVLVHPSAIGLPDHERQHMPVNLTKAQVEASPDIQQDRPVTMQMQDHLYDYYGWYPYWGPDYHATDGAIGHVGAVEGPNPSHRLLLGNQAYDGAVAKLAELRRDFEAWEAVSRGADFPKDEADRAA